MSCRRENLESLMISVLPDESITGSVTFLASILTHKTGNSMAYKTEHVNSAVPPISLIGFWVMWDIDGVLWEYTKKKKKIRWFNLINSIGTQI